ncbi:MAG: ABC transporter ATP-binding protein [Methanomassiliicoccales archaeon]
MVEKMIEIEDLYVNFYTPAGKVKALDGVNLNILKGETFGLVGETGCGKSVTANTVMKLVPMPPGKIEGGSVYFLIPEEIQAQKAVLDAKIADLIKGGATEEDAALQQAREEKRVLLEDYDLIQKNKKYMQKICGKFISMIFQEPMSALNPVFTAGDQISEIILLHEKKEIATACLASIATEMEALKAYKRTKLLPSDKGERKCGNCGQDIAGEPTICPNCSASFESYHFRSIKRMQLNSYRKHFIKMEADPDSRSVRWSLRIPIIRSHRKMMRSEATDRAVRMLRLVRIPDPDQVVKQYPHELSGGMQQRVMIAMALSCKPYLLIADEPTTALDVTIQAQILKLMKELQDETGTSILLITHNLGVVAETCERVGVMYAGAMAEVGRRDDIFREPLHPYSQGLLNSIPRMNTETERLETIEGNVPNLIRPPDGCRFNPRCPFAMELCHSIKPQMQEVRPEHFVACHLYRKVDLK